MENVKTKPRKKLENIKTAKKASHTEQNILQLNIKSLPEMVGFFKLDFEHYNPNTAEQDYYSIALKLNYYVSKNYPEYYESLEFDKEIDNSQSFISKMIYAIISENNHNSFTENVFLKYTNSGQLFLMNLVDFYPSIVYLTADEIDAISNTKMKALYAHFFNMISLMNDNGFMQHTYLNEHDTYLIDNEFMFDDFEYEMDSLREANPELSDDDNEELNLLIMQKDDLIESYIAHFKKSKRYKRKIENLIHKNNLKDLSTYKFKSKVHNEMRDLIMEVMCYDLETIIENLCFHREESHYDMTSIMMTTLSDFETSKDSLSQEYLDSMESSLYESCPSSIYTVKILNEYSVTDLNTEESARLIVEFYDKTENVINKIKNGNCR